MSEISDLELAVCLVLNELTETVYDSVHGFCAKRTLKPLLLCLDARHFAAEKEYAAWEELGAQLMAFGRRKNVEFSVEFDAEGIEREDLAACISAAVQLLALVSLFNARRWEQALGTLTADNRDQVKYAVEEVMAFVSPSKNSDFMRMLRRLEEEETRRCELETKTAEQQRQLQKLGDQLARAEQGVGQKEAELVELRRVKAATLLQLEEFYAAQAPATNSDYSAKIARLNAEREELAAKLAQTEALLCDAANQGEKLKVQLAVSENKRREAESLVDTCEKLRKSNEELRVELGVADSKLQLLAMGEKIIQRYQERAKAVTQENTDLRLNVADLEAKLRNFEQKVRCADENLQYLQQSTLTGEKGTFSTVGDLEDENLKLRDKVQRLELHLDQLRGNLSQMDADSKQLQMVKMRALSLENNMLSAKNRRFEMASRIGTFTNFDMQLAESEPRLSIKVEQSEDVVRARKASDDRCEIMYSLLVEHAQRAMYDTQRLLLPSAGERTRDPLKPFTLNNVLRARAL